jgi:release factor glutamine methyltransferase
MAQANARALGLADRFIAMAGDWYKLLDPAERFDCIVSNPPYIETQAVAGLAREVRDFDPALALDGGPSGLDPYAIIANGAFARLTPGGAIALEIGASQGAAVREIIENAGFSQVEVHADLAGHDRMVTARA